MNRWEPVMTRCLGLVVLASAMLAGCAPVGEGLPDIVRVELPASAKNADPDITRTSLRPAPITAPSKLPRSIEQPDLSLRLRNSYARLQLQLPMLPRRLPVRLTAIARSYWEPDDMGEPRGKFLLRLNIPLSSAPVAAASPTTTSSLSQGRSTISVPGRIFKDEDLATWQQGAGENELIDDWIAGFTVPAPVGHDRE